MASEQTVDHKVPWRGGEDDLPSPGMFVEISKDGKDALDAFYWTPGKRNPSGLLWRPSSPAIIPTQGELSHPAIPKDDDGKWYVVKIDPQLEVSTVWRVHELGRELFTPLVRERRPTNKRDKNGQKICVLKPKPMFRGYGFIRRMGLGSIDKFLDVRGVSDFMRDERLNPVTLPHEAILAIFAKQHAEHQLFMQAKGGRVSTFKPGDMVRIDEGSVYSGLIAQIEKVDAKGRYQILLGMIRHTLPADMVVAA